MILSLKVNNYGKKEREREREKKKRAFENAAMDPNTYLVDTI